MTKPIKQPAASYLSVSDGSPFNIGDIVLCHKGRSMEAKLRIALIIGKKSKNGYIPTFSIGYTKRGYIKLYPFMKHFGSMVREKDISLFDNK